jgi:hypothetical protein
MQDKPAACCQCCFDQELAGVHVIHWAQNPTPFVNIHHGHFAVPHGPCTPLLTRQQVLVWQGKPACNVHTLLSTQKHGSMTKASKTTSISLQMCEYSVDLPSDILEQQRCPAAASGTQKSKLAGCGRVVSTELWLQHNLK